jgi:hypothetical protein
VIVAAAPSNTSSQPIRLPSNDRQILSAGVSALVNGCKTISDAPSDVSLGRRAVRQKNPFFFSPEGKIGKNAEAHFV